MLDDPDEAGNDPCYRISKIIYDYLGAVDFSGSAVIVMWSCLLQLLTKCRREGCGSAVNPDNMITQRNGKWMGCWLVLRTLTKLGSTIILNLIVLFI